MIILHCLLVFAVTLAHFDHKIKKTETQNRMLQKQEGQQFKIQETKLQRINHDKQYARKTSETKLDETIGFNLFRARNDDSSENKKLHVDEKINSNFPFKDNPVGKTYRGFSAVSTNSNATEILENGTAIEPKEPSTEAAKSSIPKIRDRSSFKKVNTLSTRKVSNDNPGSPHSDAEFKTTTATTNGNDSRELFLATNSKTLNTLHGTISANAKSRQKRATFVDERNLTHQNDYCGEILGSCSFAANKQKWSCSCDSRCNYFDDCCFNVDLHHPRIDETKDQTDDTKYRFECYNLYNSNVRFQSFTKKVLGVLAVGSCPESYNNETVKARCEHGTISDEGPFVINNNSIAFKNKICALCNGIEMFKTFRLHVFIPATYDAIRLNRNQSSISFLRSLHEDEDVSVQYALEEPIGSSIRGCFLGDTDLDTTNNNSLCKEYSNPVDIITRDNRALRISNVHCAEGLEILDTFCLRETEIDVNDKLSEFSGFQFKMAIMFTFSEDKELEEEEGCEIWDQRILDTGKCQSYDVYRDVPSVLEVGWISDQNLTGNILKQIAIMTPWFFTVDNISEAFLMYWANEDKGTIVNVRIHFKCIKPSFLHEVENLMNIAQNRKVYMTLNDQSEKLNSKLELSNGFKNISENIQIVHEFPLYVPISRKLNDTILHVF